MTPKISAKFKENWGGLSASLARFSTQVWLLSELFPALDAQIPYVPRFKLMYVRIPPQRQMIFQLQSDAIS